MKNILFSLAILMSLLVVSCSDDTKEDKCKDVSCSGFGTCEVVDDTATCKCDTAYHSDGLTCVKDTIVDGPCKNISCGDNGTCVVSDDKASCDCSEGFHEVSLTCIKDTIEDPCKDITCGDNGTCQIVGSQATCNCTEGYHPVGLNCVKDDVTDPCEGITCGDNGSCKTVDNKATCECADGYEEFQLTCKEIVTEFSYKTVVTGTTESEAGFSVSIDADDNRWVTGEFTNSFSLTGCTNTLNSTTGVDSSNAFVAKLDKTGKCLNLLKLESSEVAEPHKILVDGTNVFVIGSFLGNLSVGGVTLTSTGEADIFLVKLDTNANYVASKTLGSASDDYGYGLTVDNNNIYISGSFKEELNFGNGIIKTSNGEEDLFIAKLNSGLEVQWVYSVGSISGNEVVNDLIVKASSIYAVGEFSGSTDFDDGISKDKKTPLAKDGFIVKLDTDGVYSWSRHIGGELDDYLSKVVIDSSDNLYVAGSFIDIIDADWGEEAGDEDIFIADGHRDVFITKLSSEGVYINTRQFIGSGDTLGHKGDDFVKDMIIDADNKLYIVGVTSDLLSFNPYNEDDDLRITEGGYDMFLAVLNEDSYDYAVTVGGDLDDFANSIDIDSTGMLVITGSWQNTAQFNPDSDTPDEKTSLGNRDFFLWNYKK